MSSARCSACAAASVCPRRSLLRPIRLSVRASQTWSLVRTEGREGGLEVVEGLAGRARKKYRACPVGSGPWRAVTVGSEACPAARWSWPRPARRLPSHDLGQAEGRAGVGPAVGVTGSVGQLGRRSRARRGRVDEPAVAQHDSPGLAGRSTGPHGSVSAPSSSRACTSAAVRVGDGQPEQVTHAGLLLAPVRATDMASPSRRTPSSATFVERPTSHSRTRGGFHGTQFQEDIEQDDARQRVRDQVRLIREPTREVPGGADAVVSDTEDDADHNYLFVPGVVLCRRRRRRPVRTTSSAPTATTLDVDSLGPLIDSVGRGPGRLRAA